MKVTALAPWYGSNRLLAAKVGELLDGCSWVGVPFVGGLSELVHLTARTVVANDLHRHIVNMAAVVACPLNGPRLYRRLRREVFHPDTLANAQAFCNRMEALGDRPQDVEPAVCFEWAAAYFICAWMARNGTAGTDGEFKAGLSFRWEAGGGDSAVRFRSAIFSLRDWRRVLARVTFDCRDAFEFLAKCKDQAGHGLYIDAPWPSDGDHYRHKFTEAQQRQLAEVLTGYQQTRVVVRFGDHELIRELYPASHWRWLQQTGRTAANKAKAEVLLVNQTVGDLFGDAST